MANPKRSVRTVKDAVPHDVAVFKLEAKTKEAAITELLNVLVINGTLPLDKERTVRDAIIETDVRLHRLAPRRGGLTDIFRKPNDD